MTTISGKIYQMKNAAGTENRFPRTVMEAVYGLSTYLQDQFSALADIYMPIDGITESKTGQEFVYRKSHATIKAKSLTLDRIYGKTLAWNQLFAQYSSTDGSVTVSTSNNVVTFSGTANHVESGNLLSNLPAGHKYYVCFSKINKVSGANILFYPDLGYSSTFRIGDSQIYSFVYSDSRYPALVYQLSTGNSYNLSFKLNAIDLTLLYGSAIDGLTDEQILAKFESEFPGYHDFGNKLISNDAESIETVGFNLWDEEWINGYYASGTGVYMTSEKHICSKNMIPVLPSTQYYSKQTGGYVVFYDANKNHLSTYEGIDSNHIFTTPAGCYYIHFNCGQAYGSTYQHNIAINLFDPAKNGTYEPYKESILPLNFSNLRVKSHNIFDEVWEAGSYNGDTGEPVPTDVWSRSANAMSVSEKTTYYATVNGVSSTYYYYAFFYSANGSYLGNSGVLSASSSFTTPAGCAFMKFQYKRDIGSVTSYPVCINVSSSFNGQYEPHGDIAITDGLKSAGTVMDEIVGNKYIKRLGYFEVTADTSLDAIDISSISAGAVFLIIDIPCVVRGRNLSNVYKEDITSTSSSGQADGSVRNAGISLCVRDTTKLSSGMTKEQARTALVGLSCVYELATPIEYELVEPLVYSMAAGTTEARVSPNTDGLSAPFCCDMTYDANANNDSANAQYALTAGRLYNTHKLWGRDFDGSNDVSGALSGVTTIDASGNITTAAQLISTVATGTAPLSVASTTEVANLHSYTATKLHTQRTLWGQNFDGSGNVTGDMSSVGNIAFSASGKNIASLLYFDTTNSRVGVGASSPAYKLDVNGTLNASGNATLGGTLGVIGNTTIGGTFTVGTSSVNKATTLYGALTASGAVSFSDTLTIAGLTTFNGNAILPANKTFTIGPSSGTHAVLEWDATNGCVKITGNLRVTGWIEQQGTQS